MKKLLIIGAGFLQDFVIRKAVAMGYKTFAVDANPQAIGLRHAHKHAIVNIVDELACLKFAQEEQIDGVLTAATDYGVLSASYVAQEMGLPGLKYEVAQLIKNKYRVRKRLTEFHVGDTIDSYEISETSNLTELADELNYPVMVKPCDGSGSRGASRVNKKQELFQACHDAINHSISRRAEIESFIIGQEYGAESLVIDGKVHVLAIMKKWMTEPPFYAELGHAIPCGLPVDVERRAKETVCKAINALGINFGSVNMDMLITSDGRIVIIDVGARMGGNMIGPCIIPYGTGIDYMSAMIQNALSDPVDLSQKEHMSVVSRLLAFKEGQLLYLPNIEKIEREYDVEVFHHLCEGMHINEYHTNLDGYGYVIARGLTTENAEKRVMYALSEIEQSILH